MLIAPPGTKVKTLSLWRLSFYFCPTNRRIGRLMDIQPPIPSEKYLDPWYQSDLCAPIVIPAESILVIDRIYFEKKTSKVILKMILGHCQYRLLCTLSDINQMEYELA